MVFVFFIDFIIKKCYNIYRKEKEKKEVEYL